MYLFVVLFVSEAFQHIVSSIIKEIRIPPLPSKRLLVKMSSTSRNCWFHSNSSKREQDHGLRHLSWVTIWSRSIAHMAHIGHSSKRTTFNVPAISDPEIRFFLKFLRILQEP
ncbi:hypothetical protein CEXT_445081 [Caerostris extrusa]|uniref:Uncharacterized protein n=1 Tax=Caerostris extrusa TaxID=172846 RepID=A0AAV4Y6B5_CAEEX|nr:hypothetical protein CEXT_445081 [Caerostris extrusa]